MAWHGTVWHNTAWHGGVVPTSRCSWDHKCSTNIHQVPLKENKFKVEICIILKNLSFLCMCSQNNGIAATADNPGSDPHQTWMNIFYFGLQLQLHLTTTTHITIILVNTIIEGLTKIYSTCLAFNYIK